MNGENMKKVHYLFYDATVLRVITISLSVVENKLNSLFIYIYILYICVYRYVFVHRYSLYGLCLRYSI